jgi:FKBP-type peptidyl-prolyl cis-trans isomerase FkpA
MATPAKQRIGIWIIAIVMTIGTLGSFAVMVLANNNQQTSAARLKGLMTSYQSQVTAQTDKLSAQYYPTLSQYASEPAAFDAASVTELTTKDLAVGDGVELKDGATNYSIYYIGWNPKGKVFDQSISGGKLKAPLAGGQFVEGMNKGVVGMKIGGVREISIPAAQAYGTTGSGADIPPNTPIKFIVLAIPSVTQIQPSKELMDLYAASQQK